MSATLLAIADGRLMGEVVWSKNRLLFRYDSGWQSDKKAFPLSLSMPLVVQEHGHAAVEAFLWGLLPDNDAVLERWGRRFKVSARNPFRLIEHVGEDCAGAVQFARPNRLDDLLGESSGKPAVKWLSPDDLTERIALLVRDAAASRLGGDTGQFSLAGAQPKIALYRDAKTGRWGIPEGRTPTTHIMKPSTGAFEGQIENEHFCLRLAMELGFPTAGSWLVQSGEIPVIVIERYDRLEKAGRMKRVHQEDFCQALACRPQNKYQNQGGPSAKAVAELLRIHSSAPEDDVHRFVDSLILNWLIVGTDAHAKNYSLLIGASSKVRLSPLYDLASSLPYPKQIQPRKATLAMKIGREYRAHNIGKQEWENCARELRLSPNELIGRIAGLADRLPGAAERTGGELIHAGMEHPVIPELIESIAKNAKRCLKALV